MNVIELHPEELLDREIEGDLTTDERARLDAHLANCDACRFERTSRADFRDDFASLGQGMKLGGMVTLAMKASLPPPAALPAPPKAIAPPNRRARTLLLVAAALLLLGTGAAASRLTEGQRLFAPHVLAPPEKDARRPETEVVLPHGVVAAPAPSPPPPSPLVDAPVVVPTSIPVPPEPPAPCVLPAVARPVRVAVRREAGPVPVVPPAAPASLPVSPTPPPRTAGVVFDEANLARARGDYASAITLYREIDERFASSPEAMSAAAIVGQLLLDRGDALGALARFEEYVARGRGALREEAMIGRASALRQLGRAAAERDAWLGLLAEFPHSARAEEARARVASLGAR